MTRTILPPNFDDLVLLARDAGDAQARNELSRILLPYAQKIAFKFLKGWAERAGRKVAFKKMTEDAKGIANTAVAAVVGRLGGFKGESSFLTYLGGAVKNQGRKYVRADSKHTQTYGDGEVTAQAAGDFTAQDIEDLADQNDTPEQIVEEAQLQQEGQRQIKLMERDQTAALEAAIPSLKPEFVEILRRRASRPKLDSNGRPLSQVVNGTVQKVLYVPSYKEIAQETGLSVTNVMQRLYRARKQLEKVSGVPLSGLVGQLAQDFEGIVKSTRGRKPRANPYVGVLIYFETEDDVYDLVDAGLLEEEMLEQCLSALQEM